MKKGDYIRATSMGGWVRISGIFVDENVAEIYLEVDSEIRHLRKDLFTFVEIDVNGRAIG